MEYYAINETRSHMSFRERLRWEYKIFEEERKKQKEAERSEYFDLEKELQRKFSELFGDGNDQKLYRNEFNQAS